MTDFDGRMAQLRARFIARTRDDEARLATAVESLDRDEIRLVAHGLSGAGGTFGFPIISAEAQAVEDALDENVSDAELRELCGGLARVLQLR